MVQQSATHLLARVSGYLEILSAHGVGCRVLRPAAPGRVIYEDDVQIVVVPHALVGVRPKLPSRVRMNVPSYVAGRSTAEDPG